MASDVDFIRREGTCPHFHKWLGTGTTMSMTTNKLYWSSQIRSPKRLIVLVKPKSGGPRQKKFPALGAGRVSLAFEFVPAPLKMTGQNVAIKRDFACTRRRYASATTSSREEIVMCDTVAAFSACGSSTLYARRQRSRARSRSKQIFCTRRGTGTPWSPLWWMLSVITVIAVANDTMMIVTP